MKKISLLAIAVSLTLGTATYAAPVAVTNASFESPTQADGTYTTYGSNGGGNPPGWTIGSDTSAPGSFYDAGIENPTSGEYTSAAGNGTPFGGAGSQVLFLNAGSGSLNVYQDVGLLAADTTYTLTLAIGQRLDRVNDTGYFGLYSAAAGTTDVVTEGNQLAAGSGVSSVAGSFQDFSITYTTGDTVSGDLYIDLATVASGLTQASFDNIRLDAISTLAVPEPSTWALLLGGLGVVALFRRFRNPSSQS